MSFFGHLLAGAGGAAGTAFLQDAAAQEKLDAQRELQSMRQEAMMERLLQQQAAKFSPAAAAVKGGGATPIESFERSYLQNGSDHPETQRAYELMGSYNQQAQQQFAPLVGRALAGPDQAPTSADVLASMQTDGQEYTPEPPANATIGLRERLKGEQGLMRLRVLMTKPEAYDDYTKGERQAGLNDFGYGVAEQTLAKGGTLDDAARSFQQRSATQDDQAKTDRVNTMAETAAEKAAAAERKAEADRQSREILAKEKEIAGFRKAPSGGYESASAKQERMDNVARAEAELKALKDHYGRTAVVDKPAAQATSGKSSASSAARPKDLATAYMQKYGSK
jgi:hypothetical protein